MVTIVVDDRVPIPSVSTDRAYLLQEPGESDSAFAERCRIETEEAERARAPFLRAMLSLCAE